MNSPTHFVLKTSETLPPIPKGAIRSLAFDPSLSCTGFALADVWDDGRMPSIALRRFGYIEPTEASGADLWTRAWEVAEASALEALAGYTQTIAIQVVAVEMPMTSMGGMKDQIRSTSWLPNYGVLCGAVASRLATEAELKDTGFCCPSATLWSSGIKTGGKGKPNRIAMANMMAGVDLVSLVGKTRAENVADAILLGRWAAIRHRVEMGVRR